MEVVRFFEDKDIIHVQGNVDPARDMETIAIELQLADLQNVEKRLSTVARTGQGRRPRSDSKKTGFRKISEWLLEAGKMANTVHLTDEEKEHSKDIQLLTTKPMMFVANNKFDLDKKDLYLPPRKPRMHLKGYGMQILDPCSRMHSAGMNHDCY